MKVACENCRTAYDIPGGGIVGCPTCGHVNVPKSQRAAPAVPLPEDEILDHGKTMMGALEGEMADETTAARKTVEGRKMGLPPGQEAALVVLEGDGKDKRIPLTKTQTVLGRKGADILLNDPEASRRHCSVTFYGDLALVKDMNSANGTRINNRIVREGLLKPGDKLQIGMTVFQFTLKASGG